MTLVAICPDGTDHPGDRETWNDSRLFDPGLFKEEGAEVVFGAGGYRVHERIRVGSHVTVRGAVRIDPPAERTARTVIDPTKMAVLWADHKGATQAKKDNSDTGGFRLEKTTGTTLKDLFLLGYMGVDAFGTKGARFERVGASHRFTDGRWAWFQQTGAFYLHNGCTGSRFVDCMGQDSQHHTYLLHDGGWIKDTVFERCRGILAGCGLEPDGKGYGDWSVVFDLAEQTNVDGVRVIDCTATEGGKVGFYTEPETTGNLVGGDPYVRKGVYLKGCLAIANGRYGGGMIGEMRIKEGEQANYYGGGWTLEDCLSIGGAKAGFYSRQEYNAEPLVMRRCTDVGSNIGFLLELAAAAGTYEQCYAYQPKRIGWKVMGSGPVVLRDCDVAIAEGSKAEPFHLGGYTRVYAQDSRDSGHKASVAATSAQTYWGMSNLQIAGRVATAGALYVVHPGTAVNVSRVKLERVASLPVPTGYVAVVIPDEQPPAIPDTPEVPPIVLPPEPQPHLLSEDGCIKTVLPDGTKLMLVGGGFMDDDAAGHFPHGSIWRRAVE